MRIYLLQVCWLAEKRKQHNKRPRVERGASEVVWGGKSGDWRLEIGELENWTPVGMRSAGVFC